MNHLNKFLTGILAVSVSSVSVTEPLRAEQSKASPNAEIAVSAGFLRKLTETPISRQENVQMNIDGANISSQISGQGIGYIAPWNTGLPGLSFCLDAQSTIHTNIDATVAGPARVFVNTDGVAITTTNTRKCFILNESELKSYASKTNADTRLTITNLNVWANGLFPRLKTRIGERKAREELARRVPENEREISAQAIRTINEALDSQTEPLKKKVTDLWVSWLRQATIHSKVLPNPMRFFSTNSALYAFAPSDQNAQQLELSPAGDEAVIIRARSAYLEDVARAYLGGQTFSDIDILSMFLKQEGDFSSPEELLGTPDEVKVRFRNDHPLLFSMTNGLMSVTGSFDSLSTEGKDYGPVNVELLLNWETDASKNLILHLPETLIARSRESNEVIDSLSAILSQRWAMIIPVRQLNITEIIAAKAPQLPLRSISALVDSDQITITALQGSSDSFKALKASIYEKFKQ